MNDKKWAATYLDINESLQEVLLIEDAAKKTSALLQIREQARKRLKTGRFTRLGKIDVALGAVSATTIAPFAVLGIELGVMASVIATLASGALFIITDGEDITFKRDPDCRQEKQDIIDLIDTSLTATVDAAPTVLRDKSLRDQWRKVMGDVPSQCDRATPEERMDQAVRAARQTLTAK